MIYHRRIYFLRQEAGERLIKIGCSTYPEARRKQLQIDMKIPLTLLAETTTTVTSCEAEAALHRAFAEDRVTGEWFRPTPKLLQVVQHVKDTGLVPDGAPDQRRNDIAKRYLAGETLQQIGSSLGITRERVRQIMAGLGVPRRTAMEAARIVSERRRLEYKIKWQLLAEKRRTQAQAAA